jgi:hypothetical protein
MVNLGKQSTKSAYDTVLDGSGPIIKIESERKSAIKIGNITPKVGEFILEPSSVVSNGIEARQIGFLHKTRVRRCCPPL